MYTSNEKIYKKVIIKSKKEYSKNLSTYNNVKNTRLRQNKKTLKKGSFYKKIELLQLI